MAKPEEVKRYLTRETLNPSGEIQRIIKDKKRVRSTHLLSLINKERRRKAESAKVKLSSMSPRTLYKHIEKLEKYEAIRKHVVSHKEVYYLPGSRFDEEWTNVNTIEAVARLLNSLDRSLGLIESIRMFDKIRKKPGRMKELENSARVLCRVFDGELPEPSDEEYIAIQTYQENET